MSRHLQFSARECKVRNELYSMKKSTKSCTDPLHAKHAYNDMRGLPPIKCFKISNELFEILHENAFVHIRITIKLYIT